MVDHSGVLSVSDIGAIYKRRKIPVLLTIVIVLAISSYFAVTLPSIYRSTAYIQIDRKEIPDNLLNASTNEYGADEISASTRQVMTLDNLGYVIAEADLYPDKRTGLSTEVLIPKLRSNIHINIETEERTHPRTGRIIVEAVAFTIKVDDQSPVKAQKAAALLADLYLNINRQRRTKRAEGVSAFLGSEANRLNTELSKLEQRLSEFKKQNTYLLPEFASYNFQLTENTTAEIKRQEERIKALLQKRSLLQTQSALAPLDSARIQLAEALQKYTQQHPRVLALKRTIATLEQQERNSGDQRNYSYTTNQDNTKVQGQIVQLKSVDAELSAARTQLIALKKKSQEYELRQARAPDVERKYLVLTRDYENALRKYSELKDKQMEARLTEELEKAQKSDRFSLRGLPQVPSSPISPNRGGIVSLGLAVSLLISILLASFLEYLDPTVRGTEGVNAVLHEPPLGVVPYIST